MSDYKATITTADKAELGLVTPDRGRLQRYISVFLDKPEEYPEVEVAFGGKIYRGLEIRKIP